MNESSNTIPTPTPVPTAQGSVPPVAPQVPSVTPIQPVESAPVPVVSTTPSETPVAKKLNLPHLDPQMFKHIPRKFKIMGGVVGTLVILLILASFTKQGKQVKQLILPSPSPIPASSPVGEVLVPTQYATDPEVLDIEKTMSEFDSKLSSTDLREDSLRVPSLDYAVDFTKK